MVATSGNPGPWLLANLELSFAEASVLLALFTRYSGPDLHQTKLVDSKMMMRCGQAMDGLQCGVPSQQRQCAARSEAPPGLQTLSADEDLPLRCPFSREGRQVPAQVQQARLSVWREGDEERPTGRKPALLLDMKAAIQEVWRL
jgi:hypothetical protein